MNTDEEDLDIKLSSIELFDRDNNLIEFDFNQMFINIILK